MGDRRLSRELALQALFYMDVNPLDPDQESGQAGREQGLDAFCTQNEDQLVPGVKPFFLDLVQGVTAHREEIDSLLNASAKHWKISRMPVVDRNVMRIAVFELLKREDIPHSVSINEAVEIGKKFGTRDSGAFINGVLDRIRTKEGL